MFGIRGTFVHSVAVFNPVLKRQTARLLCYVSHVVTLPDGFGCARDPWGVIRTPAGHG